MADYERLIVSKLLWTGEFSEALRFGITDAYFHDDEHLLMWQWMREHWTRYTLAPGRDALRMEHPEYRISKTPEPLAYYLDRIAESHKRAETFDIVADAGTLLRDEEIDETIKVLSDGLTRLATQTTRTEDIDVISTWKERMARWDEIHEHAGELVGIPTGFNFIDEATGGLQPEQFIVLIGPQKSGKSSIALSIAISASMAGYSVVFIGFEMANREQEARHDAMRAGFNPNKLLRGTATDREMRRLGERLAEIEKTSKPIHFVHDMGARTLSSAVAKVHQYKPDLVIVDGVYMMDAEIPGVEGIDTKALTKISRALKVLGQDRKIPVLATTQALDWKWSPKKGLTTAAAGYTSAFGQDCDLMLGVEPPDDENTGKLRIVAGRSVGRQVAFITFDWEHGTISEREHWEGGDEDDAEDEPSYLGDTA